MNYIAAIPEDLYLDLSQDDRDKLLEVEEYFLMCGEKGDLTSYFIRDTIMEEWYVVDFETAQELLLMVLLEDDKPLGMKIDSLVDEVYHITE